MTLEEFARLIEEATPGPWQHDSEEDWVSSNAGDIICRGFLYEGGRINAAYIAACREMVPKLIEAIKLAQDIVCGHEDINAPFLSVPGDQIRDLCDALTMLRGVNDPR